VNPKAKAAAHVVIDKDGKTCQLAPFNIKTWHAGKSKFGGRSNFNKFSIGIEIVNYGLLTKRNGVIYSGGGHIVDEKDTVEIDGQLWDKYPLEQIKAVDILCQGLVDEYGINKIVQHSDIAPGRKIDPGPAFPWDLFYNKYGVTNG
jgi:N-acetylmuramoyl-L-alanine amidase